MSEQLNNYDIDFKDSYLRLIKAISSSNIYLKVYEKNSIFLTHNGFNQSDFDNLVAIGDLSVFENWGLFSLDNIITSKKHIVMTDDFFELLNRDHAKYPKILRFVNYNWVRLGITVERALKYPNVFYDFDNVKLNKKTFIKLVESNPTRVFNLSNVYADLKNYINKATGPSLKYIDNISIESYLQLGNGYGYGYRNEGVILDNSIAKKDHRLYLKNTLNKLKINWNSHVLSLRRNFNYDSSGWMLEEKTTHNPMRWVLEEKNILNTLKIMSEYYDYINTNDSYREFISNLKIDFNKMSPYLSNKPIMNFLTNIIDLEHSDVTIRGSGVFGILAYYISVSDIPKSMELVAKKISEFFVYHIENSTEYTKIMRVSELSKLSNPEIKFNVTDVLLRLQEKGYLEDVSGTMLYIKLS